MKLIIIKKQVKCPRPTIRTSLVSLIKDLNAKSKHIYIYVTKAMTK